jgi:hypothetical protein
VILDNDNIKIEELKGPDHLDQHRKGKKSLKEYLEEGTIKPATGDQGAFVCCLCLLRCTQKIARCRLITLLACVVRQHPAQAALKYCCCD